MDDAAILANVGSEPDVFAVFYRRHVARLLDHLGALSYDRQQAADLCAETFAAALRGAHRFDPERESVDFWAVPVVRLGSPTCAPANRVCVVAVYTATSDPTGAECSLRPRAPALLAPVARQRGDPRHRSGRRDRRRA